MTGTATDPRTGTDTRTGTSTDTSTAAPLAWEVRERTDRLPDADRHAALADPGFGRYFTDHMATAAWTPDRGWHAGVLGAYGPLSLSPATAVLHYAQSIFEGLKAYRHADDSIWLFRPEANAARFAASARRLALPELPAADFLSSLTELVTLDEMWVPSGGAASLYLRPVMFASEAFLGVRPSAHVTYCVLASPAGSYFSGGPVPVRIWVSRDFTRAAPGGTGAAKCGGNYAASLLPQQEAYANGCDQVLFLDSTTRENVEELGGMNLWFVFDDGTVRTPPTGGTILAGITREAIVELLTEAGHTVEELPYRLADWRADAASGHLTEVFACGTAAVVTSVGTLVDRLPDGSIEEIPVGAAGGAVPADGEVTARLRAELLDVQFGRRPDTHGWLRRGPVTTGRSGPATRDRLDIYDTTLRDGAQQEGLALSVRDKLSILTLLDDLGVGFVEGGWPGAIPKDTDFFARAREVPLKNAVLAAFGSTRRAGADVAADPQVAALLAAQTAVVTLVAKAHSRHVELALRTTREENLAMVADTVAHLVAHGRRVFLDAEHFFDGYLADPGYALAVLVAAADAGAEVLVLCDTNGGMLPDDVTAVVGAVAAALPGVLLGIHTHNDSGCAVANALAAIKAGAAHVQGTINGYGERTGNADLTTIVANLELKLGRRVLPGGGLGALTHTAHTVAEITNIAAHARSPYVGASAFAHKAGLHASAIRIDDTLYQHVEPSSVGNDRRMLVSEMAGRASVELKAAELGFDVSGDPELVGRVVAQVKAAEAAGYAFDAADASFDLLLRAAAGRPVVYCDVESWQVHTASHTPGGAETGASEAIVRLRTGDARSVAVGEGNGPVNALDSAIRSALAPVYPELEKLELTDFRVRILDSSHGTDAITRVLVATTDERGTWTTVGVGANVIEASWEALFDGLRYGLLRQHISPR